MLFIMSPYIQDLLIYIYIVTLSPSIQKTPFIIIFMT